MSKQKTNTSVSTFNVPEVSDVSLVPWEDYNNLSTLKKENMPSIESIRKKMEEKNIASSLPRFN